MNYQVKKLRSPAASVQCDIRVRETDRQNGQCPQHIQCLPAMCCAVNIRAMFGSVSKVDWEHTNSNMTLNTAVDVNMYSYYITLQRLTTFHHTTCCTIVITSNWTWRHILLIYKTAVACKDQYLKSWMTSRLDHYFHHVIIWNYSCKLHTVINKLFRWLRHLTKFEEVLNVVQKTKILKTILCHKHKWMGHVLWHERVLHHLWEGRCGRKEQGN